ncbi:MAG: type II secretion system minor pseudopilin GspK [Pseudomonadota bacterium]
MNSATQQRGAALLTAMLTVTLVASFAATALWQQFRSVEVERAERERVQATWILNGALDWARLILREDARSGGADSLSEPWAVPLAESRLSSFLAADRNNTDDDTSDIFLSGQIVDAQSRLNVANLLDGGKPSQLGLQSFARLFQVLGLPEGELNLLANNFQLAMTSTGGGGNAPLRPLRTDQLIWLGIAPETLARLKPFIVLLPSNTPVNLNTAGVEVVYACIPSISMAEARKLVEQRTKTPFRSLSEVGIFMVEVAGLLTESQQSVSSRMFEVYGRLRIDKTVIQELSLVERENLNVTALYRERSAFVDNPAVASADSTLK